MNERIRELEERCWEELGEEEGMYPVFNTKKFAKLVVQEFSEQVQLAGRFGLEQEQILIRLCCKKAEQHFGVDV